MTVQNSWRSTLRHALLIVLAYAAWIVASAVGGLDVVLLRAALGKTYILFQLPPYGFQFTDRVVVLVAGATWFFLLILGESYLVQAVDKGTLRRQFFKIMVVLGGTALVLYLIPLVLGLLKVK